MGLSYLNAFGMSKLRIKNYGLY